MYSEVQTVTESGSYVNSLAKAFGSAVTTGNLIQVYVGTEADGEVTGITDTQGNTYTKVAADEGSDGRVELWVAQNITGGSNTVTVQLTGGVYNPLAIVVSEISGLETSAIDVYSTANTSSGYPSFKATGSTGTPSQDNCMVVALPGLKGSNTFSPSASGFTLAAQVSSSSNAHTAMLHKRITSAAAQSTTINWSGSLNGGVIIAVFKEAAAGTEVNSEINAKLTGDGPATSEIGGKIAGTTTDKALTFASASSQYMSAPFGQLTGNAARTYECWFKTTSSSNSQILAHGSLSSNALGSLGIWSSEIGFLGYSNDLTYPISGYNDGEWHHIRISFDGTDMYLYLDGVLVDSKSTTLNTGNSALYLAQDTGGSGYFNGTIDEVRISNIARSTGASFDLQSENFEADANTLALYHLDEGTGTYVNDCSGNGRHGTLYNTPTWTTGFEPPGTATNSEINAKLSGKASTNSEINSKVTGFLTGNSEINSKITGIVVSTSELDAKITGYAVTNSEVNAKTTGALIGNSEINARMYGDIPHPYRGVAVAGLEFAHSTLPGVEGTNYTKNEEAIYTYLASKGFTVVRLPFIWERVQPTVNGALDATYLGYIKENIAWARAHGLKVILDVHNYGRRYISGVEYIMGDGTLTTAHFADLWDRLSEEFKDDSTVIAYDLMNEPHDLTVTTTPSNYDTTATATLMYQAAVDAIEANGDTKFLIVSLDGWSGPHNFVGQYGSDPDPWIDTIYGNIVYQCHYYCDDDHSGTYPDAYKSSNNTNISGHVTPFFSWCQDNGLICLLGEYGVPNESDWQICLDTLLSLCDTYNVWATHWAAGIWYSSVTTIHPTSSYTVDRLQMETVVDYLGGSTFASSEIGAKMTGVSIGNSEVNAKVTGYEPTTSEINAKLTGNAEDTSEIGGKVTGYDESSSEINAKLTGSSEGSSEINSKLTGYDTEESEVNAKLVGTDGSQSEIDAKLTGNDTGASEINAKLTGNVENGSEINAKLTGVDTGQSEIGGKITGSSDDTSEINAKLTGQVGTSSEVNAKVSGVDTTQSEVNAKLTGNVSITDEINAKLYGYDTDASEINAKITGEGGNSSEINAKVTGYNTDTSEINAKLTGNETDTSEVNAKLTGIEGSNSEIGCKITGYSTTNSEINARLTGSESDTSEINAKLHGVDIIQSEINAKITGESDTQSEVNAKVTGSISVSSEIGCKIIGLFAWTEESKPTATWTPVDKTTSSFTAEEKPTATWTPVDKLAM